ncbi:MAG: DNA gyrase/topoisomerase IV subunit B [Candidatus Nanopelagicales bacterium]
MAKASYDAKDLSVLEGLDAVRKRPGMYIGSTDGRGLMHCVWELIDNAVDEALAGHAKNIYVTLHDDGSVFVEDDGRGIPVDIEPKTKLSGVELVMTKLHAGGKFGSGSYTASGGLHGVGASVVNALSVRMDVEVDRGGKTHAISFKRGHTGTWNKPGANATFSKGGGLKAVRKTKSEYHTGTRVRFWPDPEIFVKDLHLDAAALMQRARQTAFLVPGLSVSVKDLRDAEPTEVTYKFKGGIAEFIDHLSNDEPVTSVIRLIGSGNFVENVPVLDDEGHMVPREIEREMHVDIAMRWGNGYDTEVKSFVNVVATPKGGTHVAGFERAITKVINDQLKAQKVLKPSEDNVLKDDVQEGLVAVVSVRLPEPQFEGQTKEILGTPEASKIVANVVTKELNEWFKNPPRGDKAKTKLLLEKIANAARARIAARTSRDVQRRKNAIESSSLPAKLADCRTNEVENSELFIVEGDSALGTAKLARNSEYQALLPIRGKILNVQKASIADVLKNAECTSIISVIGGGSGRTFDLESVRYSKIILMSDADVDGAHIRTLLLTLFHKYMRPLLDEGRVFAAVPPLHRIEVIGQGKKANEIIYTYSDDEMNKMIKSIEKAGGKIKQPIQRYKGLGEMDAKQLRETTMNRSTRTLRRITVSDAEMASEVFDLLMGSDVAPRKEFIVHGAEKLDHSRIDV